MVSKFLEGISSRRLLESLEMVFGDEFSNSKEVFWVDESCRDSSDVVKLDGSTFLVDVEGRDQGKNVARIRNRSTPRKHQTKPRSRHKGKCYNYAMIG